MVKNRVKACRQRKGVKQEALAQIVGAGRSTISDIENGKTEPGIRLALRLAKALNVSVEYLFYEEERSGHGHI